MSKDLALQQTEWDLHENVELVPLEFTEENNAELFGIEPQKANEMVGGLQTTLAERESLKTSYIDVIKLEVTTENLPMFKELRLKLVKNRTQGLTKWKENEKAFYLAGGNFIQAIYNKEVAVNEEMESKLMDAEKFFENQEKEKARLLNESRIERLKPYVDDTTGLDFTPMTDEDFDDYLLGKKTRFENAKKEAEAEALRMETERLAEIERQKAIEIENAKLKTEAEAKEKELAKERAEAQAKANAIEAERVAEANKQKAIQDAKDAEIAKERAIREKLEADAKAKEQAEQKAKEEAKKEADKLAKAPIKKQLGVWVNSFELPTTNVSNEATMEIIAKFDAFKKWAETQVDKL